MLKENLNLEGFQKLIMFFFNLMHQETVGKKIGPITIFMFNFTSTTYNYEHYTDICLIRMKKK